MFFKCSWRASAALIAVFLSPHTLAQTLSQSEAVAQALSRSRMEAANLAQSSALREMATAAGKRHGPVLQLGINNLPIDGPDRWSTTRDFMTMKSIGIMQEWTREDKLQARTGKALREAEVFDMRAKLARAQVAKDASAAWADRHFSAQQIALRNEQLANAKNLVEAADAAFRSARGMSTDLYAARAEVTRAMDAVKEAEEAQALTISRLARWIGQDAAMRATRATADTTNTIAPIIDAYALASKHAAVAIQRSQQEAAKASTAVANTARKADWSWSLMYNKRGSAFSDMVSVNLSIPLQLDRAQKQDREVAAALAMQQQVDDELQETVHNLAAEIRQVHTQIQSRIDRLALHLTQLLPQLDQRAAAALRAYGNAQGTLSSAIEARQSVTQTHLDALRLRMELAQLQVQWAYLTSNDSTAKE